MVSASDLKVGMALRLEGQIYRVLEAESKAGAAKMLGTVRVRLANVRSGRLWDHHFRPLERLENVELEKRKVEFLYSDGRSCVFQRLDNFEQVELAAEHFGMAEKLLASGTELQAEFFEGAVISVDLPDTVDARIKTTAPPSRGQQDTSRKQAVLDNGMSIQVPLFMGPGEAVRIDVKTGRYVERVSTQHKKLA